MKRRRPRWLDGGGVKGSAERFASVAASEREEYHSCMAQHNPIDFDNAPTHTKDGRRILNPVRLFSSRIVGHGEKQYLLDLLNTCTAWRLAYEETIDRIRVRLVELEEQEYDQKQLRLSFEARLRRC